MTPSMLTAAAAATALLFLLATASSVASSSSDSTTMQASFHPTINKFIGGMDGSNAKTNQHGLISVTVRVVGMAEPYGGAEEEEDHHNFDCCQTEGDPSQDTYRGRNLQQMAAENSWSVRVQAVDDDLDEDIDQSQHPGVTVRSLFTKHVDLSWSDISDLKSSGLNSFHVSGEDGSEKTRAAGADFATGNGFGSSQDPLPAHTTHNQRRPEPSTKTTNKTVGEGSTAFIIPLMTRPMKDQRDIDDYGTRLYVVSLWKTLTTRGIGSNTIVTDDHAGHQDFASSSFPPRSDDNNKNDNHIEHMVFITQALATLPRSVRPWHKASPFFHVSLNATFTDTTSRSRGRPCTCTQIHSNTSSSSIFLTGARETRTGLVTTCRVLALIFVLWFAIDLTRRVILIEKERRLRDTQSQTQHISKGISLGRPGYSVAVSRKDEDATVEDTAVGFNSVPQEGTCMHQEQDAHVAWATNELNGSNQVSLKPNVTGHEDVTGGENIGPSQNLLHEYRIADAGDDLDGCREYETERELDVRSDEDPTEEGGDQSPYELCIGSKKSSSSSSRNCDIVCQNLDGLREDSVINHEDSSSGQAVMEEAHENKSNDCSGRDEGVDVDQDNYAMKSDGERSPKTNQNLRRAVPKCRTSTHIYDDEERKSHPTISHQASSFNCMGNSMYGTVEFEARGFKAKACLEGTTPERRAELHSPSMKSDEGDQSTDDNATRSLNQIAHPRTVLLEAKDDSEPRPAAYADDTDEYVENELSRNHFAACEGGGGNANKREINQDASIHEVTLLTISNTLDVCSDDEKKHYLSGLEKATYRNLHDVQRSKPAPGHQNAGYVTLFKPSTTEEELRRIDAFHPSEDKPNQVDMAETNRRSKVPVSTLTHVHGAGRASLFTNDDSREKISNHLCTDPQHDSTTQSIDSFEDETYNSTLPADSDYDSAKDVEEHIKTLESKGKKHDTNTHRQQLHLSSTETPTGVGFGSASPFPRNARMKRKELVARSRPLVDDFDKMVSRSFQKSRKRSLDGHVEMDIAGRNSSGEDDNDDDDDDDEVKVIAITHNGKRRTKSRPFENTDYLGKIVLSKRMRKATAAWTNEQDYVFPDGPTSSSVPRFGSNSSRSNRRTSPVPSIYIKSSFQTPMSK